MAKRQGLWVELQRDRAQRERVRQREFREFQQAQSRATREAAKAERDRKRQAAADERERKKLYVEDRKAEAEDMAEGLARQPVTSIASVTSTTPVAIQAAPTAASCGMSQEEVADVAAGGRS